MHRVAIVLRPGAARTRCGGVSLTRQPVKFESQQNYGLEPAFGNLEADLDEFCAQTKKSPLISARTAVLFQGTSEAFTLLPNRGKEDAATVPSLEFFAWRKAQPTSSDSPPLEYLPSNGFLYSGNWIDRALLVEGSKSYRFRILHPLDTVMLRLLRLPSSESAFGQQDKEEIRRIMAEVKPSAAMLIELLTENHLRYLKPADTADLRNLLSAHQNISENTRWFLSRFLPDHSWEEICQMAFARHQKAMGRLLPD